jgi:hypothetical protein
VISAFTWLSEADGSAGRAVELHVQPFGLDEGTMLLFLFRLRDRSSLETGVR